MAKERIAIKEEEKGQQIFVEPGELVVELSLVFTPKKTHPQ